MKLLKYLLLFFLAGLSPLLSAAQSSPEKAARNILEQQSRAWNQGNIEGFMKGYWESDSLMFIGKNGITYGWENTLHQYQKSYPDTMAMGQLHFTVLKVKGLSGQYQQVTGQWHLQRSQGDLSGYFTLLFQKIRNKWVIIMDHSS